MVRRENTRSLRWPDKTLSMLRASQLEACEKELAGLPSRCLFDDDVTDLDAEDFFDLSFYAREEHAPVLHTIDGLRALVLENFPAELALLSPDEHELMVRLCLSGGRMPLHSWDDVPPACSLVRRLWCAVSGQGDSQTLRLSNTLWLSAMLLMPGEDHQAVRKLVDQVSVTIEDSLYLLGAVPAAAPVQHLCFLLQGSFLADQPDRARLLAARSVMIACDYIITRDGRRLLVHPGFADPDQLSPSTFAALGLYAMDEEALTSALESMDAMEDPLYRRMEALLDGALRPELGVEDAAQDLVLLAKQNVSLRDMEEVLSSQLIQRPTREMLSALRELHGSVPRWLSLSASRIQ